MRGGGPLGGSLLLAAVLSVIGVADVRETRAADVQDSSAVSKPWYDEIAVNGFVSTSYSYNFNSPDDRLNRYRVFDFDDNTFKVDVAEIVVQRAATKPHDTGFRLDFAVGGSVPRVSAASGLFRDPATGEAQDFDLQQAFATYVVPAGSGLRVDAGKFVTNCGSEVIEGYDGWNDNASRSFLFGYAIPFTHTGVRAAYSFSPRASALVMVVNGWDVATDNNTSKSIGAQLALTPSGTLTIYLNGMIGAERPGNSPGQRRLGDVVAILRASSTLTFGANADYGQEEGLLGPSQSRPAEWSGVAGYVRWQLSSRFALAARGETFHDVDGVRTGYAQRLSELTLTPELRVAPRFILRVDLRADRSTLDVFQSDSDAENTQATIFVNAMTMF